ncbi:type IV secretion system protein VirB6 [Duganella sp. SG902]|uniref:type IV secretion system protein n=1 Tax=Duganella sp. SG902 TaxID=2587016 RepID=UPI00159DB3C1|nr:type IV secretion system protein [Duganella sp. SG902]NVM77464.1 type IV secretion system protein VirB6 [Duganella sp. SG902]
MKPAQNIDAAIDLLLTNFVSSKSAAMCAMLMPVAVAALTIYWIVTGHAVAQGRHAEPVKELLGKVSLISLVTVLSLSAGNYQVFIVDGLDAIGTAVIKAISGETSLAALMDRFADPLSILAAKLWSEATVGIFPRAALIFAAVICTITQAMLFAIGLGFYLLAKVSLAFLMAVGPAFIFCAISPATRKYTESWLGQALNYIFLKVFVSISVAMLTAIASQYAEHITNNLDTINIVQAVCGLQMTAVTLVIVMLFQPQLASALFGGASVAGVGRAIAQLLLHSWLGSRPSTTSKDRNAISAGLGARPPAGNNISPSPLYQRYALNNLNANSIRRTA